jgi:hypothetical protein
MPVAAFQSSITVRVYESLLELDPPRLDLLLPHATWDAPPPRPAGAGTGYADWLIAVFDRWQADGYPVRIRTFDSIIATLAGGESGTEALGLAPVRMVVIETDGSHEQADSLKVAFDGAPATGLDVFTHSLDAVLGHPGIAARQQGIDDLSATCQRTSDSTPRRGAPARARSRACCRARTRTWRSPSSGVPERGSVRTTRRRRPFLRGP